MSKVDWLKAPEDAEFYAGGNFYKQSGALMYWRREECLWDKSLYKKEMIVNHHDYEPRPKEWPSEQRIDIVGTNGGDGAHYNAPERTTSDLNAKPVSKYHRTIKGVQVDLYDVLVAYGVTCPALAHGIKKAMLPGQRHAKTFEQDIDEAIASLRRAKELAAGPTTN